MTGYDSGRHMLSKREKSDVLKGITELNDL